MMTPNERPDEDVEITGLMYQAHQNRNRFRRRAGGRCARVIGAMVLGPAFYVSSAPSARRIHRTGFSVRAER